MPKIPQYTSQAQIKVGRVTPGAPAVRVDSTGSGAAIAQAGQALAQVGQKMHIAQAQSELYKANTVSAQGQNDILLNAQNDTDPDGWQERRTKEIQDLKENIMKDIKNPLAKRDFDLRFGRDEIQINYKLRLTENKHAINQLGVNFETNKAAETQKYLTGTDVQKRRSIVDQKNRYDVMVASNAMKGDTAVKEFNKWEEDTKKADIINTAETQGPEAAIELLKNTENLSQSTFNSLKEDINKIAKKRLSELTLEDTMNKFNARQEFNGGLESMTIGKCFANLEQGVDVGVYDKTWADKKKKAILYSGGIDQGKIDDFESEIIMQIADVTEGYLNIGPEKKRKGKWENAQSYLRQIHEIELKIEDGVSKGLMSRASEKKQLGKIYDATTAEATLNALDHKIFVYDIKDANNSFKKVLPGGRVSEATRRFFYETDGKDLSKDESRKVAGDIVADMLHITREKTLNDNDLKIETEANAPKKGFIRVKDKKSGQTGTIPKDEFKESIYERL